MKLPPKQEQIAFNSNVIEVEPTTCLCSGWLAVSEKDGALAHSLPTCRDFDEVNTFDKAADLFRRCREQKRGSA